MGVRPEIGKLAELVFDSEELSYVEVTSEAMRVSKKGRKQAVILLRAIIPQRPKRPLYYARYSLGNLPMESRYVVEQMGSYLGDLVKELSFELEGNYFDKSSLGVDISRLLKNKRNVGSDVAELLKKIRFLNEVAYAPSKHRHGSPSNTRHYFSFSDVAIIALAAVKLGEELKKRSKYVRSLCQDLVLPGQRPIIGDHPRTDDYGAPFNFKEKLKGEVSVLEGAL
jgi:hypothetical protein